MYDKYDRNDSLVSWMIAGGLRYDVPDPRRILHLVALRDARHESNGAGSPLARLTSWFRIRPSVTAAAATTTTSATTCCAPA